MQVADNTKMLLAEEARKNKIEYIGLVYEDNLGPNSAKNFAKSECPSRCYYSL